MQCLQLYADDGGESHWREVDIVLTERSFAPPAGDIHVSEAEGAGEIAFLRLRAGWDEPAHPSPRRQLLVCLAGTVQVTASDGEVREIGPGGLWRMEDVTGAGHHTRVVSETDFEAVVVSYA